MNAPTPNGSLDPNNATPAEEQLEMNLGQAPGISPKSDHATGTAPSLDEDEEENKKRAALSAIHFLTWEELLEEIKASREVSEPEIAQLNAIHAALDSGFNGQFGAPKLVDGIGTTNGQLFETLSTGAAVASADQTKAIIDALKEKKSFIASDNTTFLSTSNGALSIGKQGVHFHAGKDEATGQPKEFTQEDAKKIAILAMHNKDLLPPNAVALTGTPEQRSMIKTEMENLNKMLPPNAQFIFDDELSAPASAPHKASLTEVVGGKMGKGFEDLKRRLRLGGKPADEAQDAAPETTTPPQGDVLELSKTDIAPETPAEVQSTVKTHAAETPEAQVERAALEEVLNQFPQAILKNSEKVTEIDSQDVYKARIQEPSSDLSNMKDVLFIQNDEKLKIIAVEGDGNFERLLTKPETQKPASELGEGFKPAAEGVSEDHADFIGPPRPPASPRASGEQPTPPAA